MSRVMVDLKLYPGEHHSLSVQDGVLTLSADVQALWDCIEVMNQETELIEDRLNGAWQEGYDEAWEKQNEVVDVLNDEISDLNSKIDEQEEELRELRAEVGAWMRGEKARD